MGLDFGCPNIEGGDYLRQALERIANPDHPGGIVQIDGEDYSSAEFARDALLTVEDNWGWVPVCDGYNGKTPHFGYHDFRRYRNALATAAGYGTTDLNMGDEGDPFPYVVEMPDIEWESYPDSNFYGQWDEPPDDILIALLVHSDCEGQLPPEMCEPLADRLEELTEGWPEDDRNRRRTVMLVDFLRHCAREGHPLDFR